MHIIVSFAEYSGEKKDALTFLLERGITSFVVPPEEQERFSKLGRFNSYTSQEEKLELRGGGPLSRGSIIHISSKEDEEKAAQASADNDLVVVDPKDWKIIPLENLIASYQKKDCQLFAAARTGEDMETFSQTLEVGVDGIYFLPKNIKGVMNAADIISKLTSTAEAIIGLQEAMVTKVSALGSGDRVCIDTCSLLSHGEGMLIGSQSDAFCLVHAETFESEYVNSRPFRVNAGPVHSYILMPDGKTRYLSEITSGQKVLVVSRDGKARTAIVGRVKIEERPLILVEYTTKDGSENSVILQNAETVRVMTTDGKALSVSELEAGHSIFVHIEDGGRHFGMKVEEKIKEA